MNKKYEETGRKDINKRLCRNKMAKFLHTICLRQIRSFAIHYITSKIVYHPMTNSYLNRMVIHWFHRAQTIESK